MVFELSIPTAMLASWLALSVLALALLYLSSVADAPAGPRWWATALFCAGARRGLWLGTAALGQAGALFLIESAHVATSALLVAGALQYRQRLRRKAWVLAGIPLLAGWISVFTLFRPDERVLIPPIYGLSGLALMGSGLLLAAWRPPFATREHRLVGGALVVWGLYEVSGALLWPRPDSDALGLMLIELLKVNLAVGLIVLVQCRHQYLASQATRRALESEARLLASEARYRDLIDNSVLGVLVHRNHQTLYVNKAFLRIFGLSQWPDPQRHSTRAIPSAPSEEPRLQRYFEARVSGGQAPEHYEFLAHHTDGRPIWVANTVRVIEWEGEPAIQATLYDITERRRAQEELAENRNLLGTVIDSVPHLISVRDREGRMLMVNKAWREANDLTPERYLNRTSVELGLHPLSERQVVLDATLAVVSSEAPYRHEHDLTLHGQVRRMRSIRVPLRGEDGRLVGVVSTSEDITEQRALEAQLHQAQKMEAVGQLTGGIAHDFNNLLGIVMGNLELLQTHIHADVSAARFAERAITATQRGAALTRRLLAFARRHPLQPQAVNLARQVAELLDLLQGSLGDAIALETPCDPAAGLVLVDPAQLQNTLLNLVLNSRDAMPEGGSLTIQVERVPAALIGGLPESLRTERELVMLSVCDTGMGMSPDVLSRAAEPFFTTKSPGSGSGLGLSMIDGFMTQSGGMMRIESEPGIGTTVRLLFRICAEAAPARESREAAPLPVDVRELVLVVEDDTALRNLAAQMLAELNYEPLQAGNGPEALRLLQDHPDIRLLFTDVALPKGMDGLELAEAAQRLRPELKVLYTSGYADDVFVRHERRIDSDSLVQKPYRLAELARKLEAALATGRASAS